jgi:hypothetical protein
MTGSVIMFYKVETGIGRVRRVANAVPAVVFRMHAAGIVCGFNMLHPLTGGIVTSRLIDFDLCGTPGVGRYPPEFASNAKDNVSPGAASQVK